MRRMLIPVFFEILLMNCFAFLTLATVSGSRVFIKGFLQIDNFGILLTDRVLVDLAVIVILSCSAKATAERPEASKSGAGSVIMLFFWSFVFVFTSIYENGRIFHQLLNEKTRLLYFGISIIFLAMGLMHPKREELEGRT